VFGQTTPEVWPPKTSEGFDIEDFVRRSMHDIWNWRMFNKIAGHYADNYLCHSASGREMYGRDEFTAFVLSMLAMFPDARFSIDHLFWNGDEREGYRTAMRWSLVGTHTGHGIYGMPTGKRVRIWGMTQHIVKNGRFVEEWTLFNELALLKQLYLARTESGQVDS
jgi:predicted ester cyclase